MDSVYVLELENSKYFLINTTSHKYGRELDVDYLCVYLPDSYTMTDVVAFFAEYPHEWLQLHKPLCVISKLPGDDDDLHRQLLYWIRKKGIENVRGGIANTVVLSKRLTDFLTYDQGDNI